MQQIALSGESRATSGKGPARRMRVEGMIPAVVYGGGHQPQSLSIPQRDLEKVLRQVTGDTAFVSLSIEGQTPKMALIKDLQLDSMGKRVLHADFYEISPDQELTVDVTIELTGEAKGVELGGVVSQQAHSVAVTGRVADIPDTLTVDISELDLNQTLHSDQLVLPAGVSLATEENFAIVICSLVMERAEEEEEGEEGEEAGEGSAEE
ncbi:MAG: 50S ribosomal protein L25 [Deltaproteobacteria bacterium]|nr:50S ribosomal protein L25 [Deltaproteobacteria bacterium]